MTRKPKPNATLRWVGRKLMCNGVEVARLWQPSGGYWYALAHRNVARGKFLDEGKCRRAINKQFNLPADYGVTNG